MIIKNKTIFPSYLHAFKNTSIDTLYDKCHFIGFNFGSFTTDICALLDRNCSIIFRYCIFEYCVFNQNNTSLIFRNCIFRNCTYIGIFDAYVNNCHFIGSEPYVPTVCPTKGAFIGWKMGLYPQLHIDGTIDGTYEMRPCIIKLLIPTEARRSSGFSRKCRCSKAQVLDIRTLDGNYVGKAFSSYDYGFTYEPRKIVTVPDFDENRWHECAPGIHFFMEQQEAINYWM